MPPRRIGRGGFSCFGPVIDVYVREDHQTGIAGIDLKGDWHENGNVGQNGIRQGAELHRRLNAGSLGFRIETDDVAGQSAMQGMEDFLLQRFALFMGQGVVHDVLLSIQDYSQQHKILRYCSE